MCSVLILERANSCRVVCECGLDKLTRCAPDSCPQCGRHWDTRIFRDGNSVSPGANPLSMGMLDGGAAHAI